ncbi:hypothetical protein ACLB1M_25255 [Escherichia coli]
MLAGLDVVNWGISIAFVLYILTYARSAQWFDSASHLRRDVTKRPGTGGGFWFCIAACLRRWLEH